MRLQLGLMSLTLLSACAPAMGNSDAARMKVLAPALTGTYDGAGKSGPFRNNYRVLLTIDAKSGRATGVVTNTSLNKSYPAIGTFSPYNDQGGTLDMKLSDGKRDSGSLKLRLMSDKASVIAEGDLKMFLLTYQVHLTKASDPQPIPRMLPDTPPTHSLLRQPGNPVTTTSILSMPVRSAISKALGTAGRTVTIITGATVTEPLYVTPTPGPLPK